MAIIFNKSVKMGAYIAQMKIQTVRPNENRPDGFKVNFILLRIKDTKRILLVDNHAPFGYHMHDNPDVPEERKKMDVNDPYAALDLFIQRAKEIIHEK